MFPRQAPPSHAVDAVLSGDAGPLVRQCDLAAKLGLTRATVSRALSGRGQVAEATRRRVLDAARELHYTPDPVLRALSRRRWAKGDVTRFFIALVHSSPHAGDPAHTSTRTPMYAGIRKRAAEIGLQIDEFSVGQQGGAQRVGRVLEARGFDGVLVDWTSPVEQPLALPWDRLSVVSLGFGVEQAPAVVSDWGGVLGVAVANVRALGYRRWGMVRLVHGNPGIDRRLDHALAYERHGAHATDEDRAVSVLAVPPDVVREGVGGPSRERLLAWLRQENPEAVIDGTSQAAHWLADAGWTPGQRPAICTLWVKEESSPIAGVDHNYGEQGRIAVDLLASLIENRVRGANPRPARVVVPCMWRAGVSMPPAAALASAGGAGGRARRVGGSRKQTGRP